MDQNDSDTHQPTTVAILTALIDELAPTIDRLGLKPVGPNYEANISGTRIVATVTGVGATSAVAAAQRLFDQYNPSWVIVLGFAGGLDPQLSPAAVMPITWVISEHNSLIQLGDADTTPTVPRVVETAPQRPADRSLLTINRIADSITAKRQLFDQYQCAAVDMETYPLAALAAKRGLPLTVLRAVTDTANTALPPEAAHWIDPRGRARIATIACYLTTHPRQIGTLLKLRKNAQLAATRLADHAQALIRNHAQ